MKIRPNRVKGLVGCGLLMGAALLSGCASRGYVRDQVGVSADSLSARIDESQEGIARIQTDLEGVSQDVAANEEAIAATQSELEQTSADLTASLGEVEALAQEAQATADQNTERTATLQQLFDSRGRMDVVASHELYFQFDSAEFIEDQTPQLESVKTALDEDPLAVVVLEGRTDSLGEPDYNIQLGERRLEAARRYLVVELGIPIHRIHGFSFGEANPLYDNENTEERSKNRAVRVTVLGSPSGASVATSSAN